jgi:hypothetical protein
MVLGIGGLLILKDFFVPESWDAQAWYRKNVLSELQKQPLRFGGNESCHQSACHQANTSDPKAKDLGALHQTKFDQIQQSVHKTLSCEACHDALANHVEKGQKIHDAYFKIERNSVLCLTCHRQLSGRDGKIAQFSEEFPMHKMMQVTEAKSCISCHNPHAPK